MADFAEKAFADAVETMAGAEFDGFHKRIIQDSDTILTTAAVLAGMDEMERLAGVVNKKGLADVLARYVMELLTIGYHIGYKEGRLAQ